MWWSKLSVFFVCRWPFHFPLFSLHNIYFQREARFFEHCACCLLPIGGRSLSLGDTVAMTAWIKHCVLHSHSLACTFSLWAAYQKSCNKCLVPTKVTVLFSEWIEKSLKECWLPSLVKIKRGACAPPMGALSWDLYKNFASDITELNNLIMAGNSLVPKPLQDFILQLFSMHGCKTKSGSDLEMRLARECKATGLPKKWINK